MNSQRGYIALISILIASAIVLLISLSASLLSIGESKMGLQMNQASESFYLAQSCAEYALIALKNDLNYIGDETLTINGQDCTILPLEGSGNTDRVIKALSNAYNQTRKIRIEINQVNPEIDIKSWQEVANF